MLASAVESRSEPNKELRGPLAAERRGTAQAAIERRTVFVAGVKLALALAELGLIEEYEFVVQPGWRAMGRCSSRVCRTMSTSSS